MIGLGGLCAGLAGIAALSLAVLGFAFLRDPAAALRLATHRAETLPDVMANRYLALAALAGMAAWYGDPVIIATLFAVMAVMAAHDAFLYARAGHSWGRHAVSSTMSFGIAGLAWLARAGGV